ncbi:MAG: DDE-type integrase/transposase/recombinase [Thaumarchaeota archaeon]|nr:DDE-type integrase/transposase/recombinase [Nitrososphaerota archaeon]
MPEGLSEDAGQHIVRNRGKGVPASRMARDPGISARCVRRPRARYRKTGGTRPRMGRPRDHVTGAQIRPVAGACEGQPVGAARVAKSLGKNHDTSYGRACRILKKNGMVTASAAKSRRRKWVRYERLYANAMRHTDWHVMKDPRFHAYNLITYLDDASRCVTGAALFEHATSENAALLLGPAIRRFGAPAAMLSDNGSCFVGRNGRKKGPMGTRQPTVFEEELLGRGIALTNSGPYHPQTNGRPGRFHSEIEQHLKSFEEESASNTVRGSKPGGHVGNPFHTAGTTDPVTRLVGGYNNLPHMSLKDGRETPAEAYVRKQAPKDITRVTVNVVLENWSVSGMDRASDEKSHRKLRQDVNSYTTEEMEKDVHAKL